MNQRLSYDCSFAMTEHIAALLVNVLDEDQLRQLREGVFEICIWGIEAYEVQVDRMHKRLRPLSN